jgi:hypothetical protein
VQGEAGNTGMHNGNNQRHWRCCTEQTSVGCGAVGLFSIITTFAKKKDRMNTNDDAPRRPTPYLYSRDC